MIIIIKNTFTLYNKYKYIPYEFYLELFIFLKLKYFLFKLFKCPIHLWRQKLILFPLPVVLDVVQSCGDVNFSLFS